MQAIGWALATAGVMSVPAASAPTPSNVEEMIFTGHLGDNAVTVALDVRDRRVLAGGHYSYDRYRKDIALTGTVAGEIVTLREPGGGVFALRLVSADRSALRPLTFYTSTALDGRWTGNGRTLPVHLDLSSSGPATGAGRYADVTTMPAPAFEALVARFLHGATTGNRAEAAGATSFPLRINGAAPYVIRNRAQLSARWLQIFTPCYVAKLKRAVSHDMFVHNGEAMVSDGAAWFDAHGATSLNIAGCATG